MKSKNALKPSLAISLVLILLVTPSRNTLQSASTFKTLTPIATAEDIYESDRWSQSVIAEYYNAINPNNESKYLYLGLPSDIGLEGDASLAFNNTRADFYKVSKVPKYAINGIVSKEKFTDTNGLIGIPEGIKNNNQFAKIELASNQEGFYTVKVTGTDDRLSKKNIYLNAIVFKDEVNVENNKDDFGTRIVKRVAYKYAFGTAMGKSFSKLEKDKTIIQNFDLNIPKVEQAQCKILIFGQDRTTGEMYFSGYTPMVDGKAALFNVDNLPSTTLDLKDIAKYTKLNELELQMFNKPEYQEKMGYEKKAISVTDAKDLKYLSFQLDYTATEAQIYQVLTTGLNPELKDKATLKYNKEKNQVDVTFSDPINGDKILCYIYIKINKATINGFRDEKNYPCKSVDFRFREFYAYDSNHNLIKYNLREQKTCFPVRMCTIENPFDLEKKDKSMASIDKEDLNLLLSVFGSNESDPDWKPEYDIYKDGISKGRIDIGDVVHLLREINEQDAIIEEIKKLLPEFDPYQEGYAFSLPGILPR